MKTEIKKLPKSEVEIEFELTAEEFEKYLEQALTHFKEHLKVDGFRKGQVPLKIVEEKVGNENLLMEAGDLAVKKSYAQVVKEHNLEPIGEPEMQIKKIAKGSPFEFSVKVSVLPEISLPAYQELAAAVKGQEIKVEEKEVEEAISYLQKSRAKLAQVDRPAESKDFVEIEYQNKDINGGKLIKDAFILNEGGFLKDFEDNLVGMKAGDEKEFTAKFPENTPDKNIAGKEGVFKVRMVSVQSMELPELNDEFAQLLGAFDTMVSLKENIKTGITMEKEAGEKQRKRAEILNAISQKITFDIPEKMVGYESERLFEDFKNQIAQNAKIDFDQYLASVKKSEDEMKKSFNLEAEKRIKGFLVLREIGKAEKVEVSDEELQAEVEKMAKSYSKESLEKIDIGQLKEYAKGAIYNEKVLNKLESYSAK
jgi:trigger factor